MIMQHNLTMPTMAPGVAWDHVDWGDESSSTIHTTENLTNLRLPASFPSSSRQATKSPNKVRDVTPANDAERLGKRSSWIDWFESDEEGSRDSNSLREMKVQKKASQRRRNLKTKNENATENKSECSDKSSSFLPKSILTLVPLEHEGISTKKKHMRNARRRTVMDQEEDLSRLRGLREKPTKELTKRASNSSQGELAVPFPSRPRRRSAW